MEITLPAAFETDVTPEQLALNVAVGFYTDGSSLAEAADIAGIPLADFMKELGRREIPLHYDLDDLANDLATVRSLPRP